MFRLPLTWISLPDREVYQILQTTHHIQRPKATVPWHVAELDVSDADETGLETETETGYYGESASPSYSYAQTLAWSSPGRYTPDIRRGDSYIAENRLPVSVYARFGSRKVIQGDGNGRGDADTLYEIPDSTDSLSSVASSPAVTAAAYSHSASGSAGRTPRE